MIYFRQLLFTCFFVKKNQCGIFYLCFSYHNQVFVSGTNSTGQHIEEASVSSNGDENYRYHYEPKPGCSHWSDDNPYHHKKKKYIASRPKIQSLPSVSI